MARETPRMLLTYLTKVLLRQWNRVGFEKDHGAIVDRSVDADLGTSVFVTRTMSNGDVLRCKPRRF